MRSTKSLTILPAVIIPDRRIRKSLPQPLHKFLKMRLVQRTIHWQMVVIISERNETIVLIQRRLMHATNSPLSTTLQTASNTLTTGQRNGLAVRIPAIKNDGKLARGTDNAALVEVFMAFKRRKMSRGKSRRDFSRKSGSHKRNRSESKLNKQA